jgi:hypothetical protein
MKSIDFANLKLHCETVSADHKHLSELYLTVSIDSDWQKRTIFCVCDKDCWVITMEIQEDVLRWERSDFHQRRAGE